MGWSGEGKEGGKKRGKEREKKKEREKLNKECISSGLRQVLLSLDLEKSPYTPGKILTQVTSS